MVGQSQFQGMNNFSFFPPKGGLTRFLSGRESLEVEPEVGLLLLHWTGHNFLHEGAEVTAGEKFLLRSDVFYSRGTLRPQTSLGSIIGNIQTLAEEEKVKEPNKKGKKKVGSTQQQSSKKRNA